MCKEPWGSEGFFTPKLNHQVDVLQEEQLATLEEEDGRFFFCLGKAFSWVYSPFNSYNWDYFMIKYISFPCVTIFLMT